MLTHRPAGWLAASARTVTCSTACKASTGLASRLMRLLLRCRMGTCASQVFTESAVHACLGLKSDMPLLRALLAADSGSMRELTQRCAEAQQKVGPAAASAPLHGTAVCCGQATWS